MRKPHAKSVLKTLPFDRQEAIFTYLETHSLAETEAWLATQEIETNPDSLSKFRSWFPVSRQLHGAASTTEAVKELLRDLPGVNLDANQLSKAGHAIFEAIALKKEDSELFVHLRSLHQKDRLLDLQEKSAETKGRQKDKQLAQKDADLQLAERRVAVLEKKFQDAKDTLSDPSLSMPEREGRMKELFGIGS